MGIWLAAPLKENKIQTISQITKRIARTRNNNKTVGHKSQTDIGSRCRRRRLAFCSFAALPSYRLGIENRQCLYRCYIARLCHCHCLSHGPKAATPAATSTATAAMWLKRFLYSKTAQNAHKNFRFRFLL